MRSLQFQSPVHNHHQHQPQTAPMMLVQTPDGGMGWVPTNAMGQPSPQQQMAMAQMQQMQQQGMQPQMMPQQPMVVVQPPATSALKTILVLGGLGLAGWWAWKKWGRNAFGGGGSDGGDDSDRMNERGNYVKSRRRRRSRSRMLSEFKSFLDNDGAREGSDHDHDHDHGNECLECVADSDGSYEKDY